MNQNSPDHWFLSDNEVLLSKAFTSKNEVKALIDGKDYFQDVLNTIKGLQPSSKIKICGWRLNSRTKLLGDLPGSKTFEDILGDAISNNIEIKAMLWQVAGTIGSSVVGDILGGASDEPSRLIESINDFIPGHGRENLRIHNFLIEKNQEAILDNRLAPGVFGSHHQKYILIQNQLNNECTAYVGGIDIAPDRWDHQLHDEPAGREPEFFDAWHDVQVKIQGPAFSQLAECFFERWNDRRKPSIVSNVPGLLNTSDIPFIQGSGTCHVQVLRTYSCKTETFSRGDAKEYPFAPQGDNTYSDAYVKAIEKAEKYIYIEDQYFWPCPVVEALAEAAKRNVSIVLVLTNNYDVPGLIPYHNFLRNEALEKLKKSGPHVYVYSLLQKENGQDDIYVHSKTMIIDDRFAAIGSANINSRSFTTDSEMGVAIVDEDLIDSTMQGAVFKCGKFPKAYRQALWTEHLGIVSPDDPLNVNGTPAHFPTNANTQQHHVIMHAVPQPRFCQPSFIPFIFMNTNFTC